MLTEESPNGATAALRALGPMRLSIVIPTLNEEQALPASLRNALEWSDDVWVSDGGSVDRTLEIALDLGAHVVQGQPGRGGQLNRGAAQARGDVFLFLHADTRLPADLEAQIRRALEKGAVGGGFHVRYEGGNAVLSGPGNRLVAWRTTLSRCPLGDQAQFLTRGGFESVGGFSEWPILEDVDMMRRLARIGGIAVLPGPVISSARRFTGGGLVRTVATNWLIWGLYTAGVSPHRLATLYRHVR
ncbi:MAG: TIGR04283 family arsenosugar biosynthesis glycosyltransferase [Acidobacteriota bacterium]